MCVRIHLTSYATTPSCSTSQSNTQQTNQYTQLFTTTHYAHSVSCTASLHLCSATMLCNICCTPHALCVGCPRLRLLLCAPALLLPNTPPTPQLRGNPQRLPTSPHARWPVQQVGDVGGGGGGGDWRCTWRLCVANSACVSPMGNLQSVVELQGSATQAIKRVAMWRHALHLP